MANESGQQQDIDRAGFLLTLRQRGIGDQAVLRAMEQVPRAAFVPTGSLTGAYADQALPIDCGQTISQPYVVAYMTERLALKPHHRVLEVGTGSGYQAAILSKLVREVVSIERYRTLADQARERLKAGGYNNVEVIHADGMDGWPDRAPYDRILVTAAADEAPPALIEQLADDGVMIMPRGAPNRPPPHRNHGNKPTPAGGNPQAEARLAVGVADDGSFKMPRGPHPAPPNIALLPKCKTPGGVTLDEERLIAVRFVPLLAGKAREL